MSAASSPPSPAAQRRSLLPVVGWGAFVACSWTWCIGMFLPVLLVREFGLWGWVVFAAPNILGAAAVPWLLRDVDASQMLVGRHRRACLWFSVTTIGFHVFFTGWIIRLLLPEFPALVAVLAVILWLIITRKWLSEPWVALGTLGLSLLAIVVTAFAGGIDFAPAAERVYPRGLAGLAAACALGFLLCPYLDLTLHRARQEAEPSIVRKAFALGFGVFFLALIAFALGYAPLLGRVGAIGRTVGVTLGIYMAIQSAFTITLHAREAVIELRAERPTWLAVAFLAALVAPILLASAAQRPWLWFGLTSGEVIYRGFMGFYGLVFPAYVYLCVVRPRRGMKLFLGAVVLALPLFFAAFVLGYMVLALAGVALVLLAKLVRISAVSGSGHGAGDADPPLRS